MESKNIKIKTNQSILQAENEKTISFGSGDNAGDGLTISAGGVGVGGVGVGGSTVITTNRSYIKPISQPRNNLKDLQKTIENSHEMLNRGDSVALQSGVSSMKKGRAQEKRNLQELNERFASYIEKARFLEAQNKQLVSEIDKLKGGTVQDNSKIKEIYEVEINQLRNLLNESEKSRAPLEAQVDTLEYEIDDLRKRLMMLEDINSQYKSTVDKQRNDIASFEGELVELRRFKGNRGADVTLEKEEVKTLRDALKKLRQDYEREALAHLTLEHELQSLKEALDFEKQIHDTEVKELATVAYRDPTKENMVYWQSEMGRALRDIQTEYENKLSGIKQELETSYGPQMQEIRTSKTRDNVETTHYKEENVRVKSQIQSMRTRIAELERQNAEYEINLNNIRDNYEETQRNLESQLYSIQEQLMGTQQELTAASTELQNLLDAKLGLELEIAAYAKLLEIEEERVLSSADERSVMSQFMSFTSGGVSGSSSGAGGLGFGGVGGSGFGGAGGSGFAGAGGLGFGGSSGGGGGGGGGGSGFGGSMGGSGVGGSLELGGRIHSKKMSSRRTTKGNISIAESDESGSFIVLENMGSQTQNLSGMIIKRKIDGIADVVVYSIPKKVSLNAGERITVCAHGKKTGKGKEIEIEEDSWGFGENVITALSDSNGEEKAALYQEIVA